MCEKISNILIEIFFYSCDILLAKNTDKISLICFNFILERQFNVAFLRNRKII